MSGNFLLSQHGASRGGSPVPPDWAFAPWNDAIRGAENVLAVATTNPLDELQDATAAVSSLAGVSLDFLNRI